ncbi:Lar family restriction alleviation protein [Azonexus sp.]|uniref:Lar family restriction alleviation protein n=1 Tax=Azonexus sp. TaxID=1872668 RepID=UPI0035A02176
MDGVPHLAPCPFCDGTDVGPIEIDVNAWAVVCRACRTLGPSGPDENLAIALWNTRQ